MSEENEEEIQLPEAPSLDDPKVRALIKIFFGVDIEQLDPSILNDLKEEFVQKIQDILKVVLAFIPLTGQTLTEEFVDQLPSLDIPQPPQPSDLADKFENTLPEVEEIEPTPIVTNPLAPNNSDPIDYNPTDNAELANALAGMEREGLNPDDYFG